MIKLDTGNESKTRKKQLIESEFSFIHTNYILEHACMNKSSFKANEFLITGGFIKQ